MNYLSPVSWICALLAALIPFIVLLRPSLTEFIVLMIVDSSVLFVTKPIESTLFLNFYPETKYYLRKTDEQAIANFSLDQKISLYQSFVLFPKRRARFCHIGSFIKVIPAYLVMTFYWEHEISNLAQFSLVVGISLVNLWFFYAAVFLEAHIYLSDLIRDLHEKFDFSDVFSQAEPQYSKYDFLFQEVMNLLLIITFTLSLQSFVILSGSYRNKIELAIKLVCIGFIGTCLFIRIWQLSRKYHFGALETLFQQMEVVDGKQANVNLPLHTAPLLARFEKTFNLLMQRLRVSEQELSSLVVYEADKGRYRALGEISALIAHDLSAPLHVTHYCATQLKENLNHSNQHIYVDQLLANSNRALELINALRARLKNPETGKTQTSIFDAHFHVIKFLEAQFQPDRFKRIQFKIDHRLENQRFELQRVDLIHILENLYRNSTLNLLENEVSEPFIWIREEQKDSEFTTLLISDNGSGLTSDRFEKLTAFRFAQQKTTLIHEGLGLRLTRRLVELNHGALSVIDSKKDLPGTTFRLKLKRHSEGFMHTSVHGASLELQSESLDH